MRIHRWALLSLPLASVAWGAGVSSPSLEQARVLAASESACKDAAPEDASRCADRDFSGAPDREESAPRSAAGRPEPAKPRAVLLMPTNVGSGVETPLDTDPPEEGAVGAERDSWTPKNAPSASRSSSSIGSIIAPAAGAVLGGVLGWFLLATPLGIAAGWAAAIGAVAGLAIGYFVGKMSGS